MINFQFVFLIPSPESYSSSAAAAAAEKLFNRVVYYTIAG
jgi:hypothetical protein